MQSNQTAEKNSAWPIDYKSGILRGGWCRVCMQSW